MPTVLVIDPGAPPALRGRSLAGERLSLVLSGDPEQALAAAQAATHDLLVLAGMTVDEQQALARRFQELRSWRLVPVLYLLDQETPGFAIPGSYRPEVDGIARGPWGSPAVQRRVRQLARDGIGGAVPVSAGPCELDPVRARLRCCGAEIPLTAREAVIVGMLMARPGRTVSAHEIIERGWGVPANDRHLQILRRHISNIRRKLTGTPAAASLRTVRGDGYCFAGERAAS